MSGTSMGCEGRRGSVVAMVLPLLNPCCYTFPYHVRLLAQVWMLVLHVWRQLFRCATQQFVCLLHKCWMQPAAEVFC